ncbi:hypothetical protein BZA05DRAFT_350596 [Tricharina praecox]|uniref:uncharacterized protein n=1 Tax=Tricharina praecox TaxID=43433 RepID=UPI00221F5270|nr:uncharacterized protein BZA05DRAFT_350596 [Tricharina praecox]KAI5854686.1 hypothetical protein BZA05DRAFT_350596 [Tricharina praecox]
MGFFSKKEKSEKADEDSRSALFGNRKAGETAAGQNPYSAPPPPYQPQAPNASHGGPPAPVDRNRDALFGNRPQPQHSHSAPPVQGGAYARPDGYAPSSGGYGQSSGGYSNNSNADRQMTEEEEEEEDVEAVKQQIRFTKQESVASSRNALRVAAQAEETGRNTLARLGQQGERLYNTEKNLDVAASHNRVAEEKARELKTLNGSMFAIHVKNPMKSKSRAQAEEKKILDRHETEREERERTRQFGYESRDRVGKALNGGPGGSYAGKTQMSMAERSKYQFEADESDDEKEREIHNNLDQLSAITGRLKGLAMATGEEVDRQNHQIDKIMKKSDHVDNQIALTHNRIKKIH